MRRVLNFRGSRTSASAFTIIELLVAMGVTALMITLMVNISINLLKVWNTAGGQLSSGNQARAALDYLSQDIQAAVLKRDGNIWIAATVQRNQNGNGDADMTGTFDSAWTFSGGNTKPDGAGTPAEDNSLDLAAARTTLDTADRGKIENVRFGKGGVWLRFFTTRPDANNSITTISAPRAVSYQIARGRVGGDGDINKAQYFYALFRSEVTPSATFTAGYNITDGATYDSKTGSAGVIRSPDISELIANNVIDFGVRLFERDSSGNLFEVFPARRNASGAVTSVSTSVPVTYLATTSPTPYAGYGNSAGTNLAPGMPAVAEVMVRILTPEGQRILHAFEENRVTTPPEFSSNPDAYWWHLATRYSQVYTRRVDIRSTAL